MAEPTRADLVAEVETLRAQTVSDQLLIGTIRLQIHAEDGESTTDRLNTVLLEGDSALEELDLIRERLGVADDVKVSDAVKALVPTVEPTADVPESQYVRYLGGGSLGFNHDGSYHTIGGQPVSIPTRTVEFALATYSGQIVLAKEDQA